MKKSLRFLVQCSLAFTFFLLLFGPGLINAQSTAPIFRDDFSEEALSKLWQKPTNWSTANQSAYFFDGQDRWLRTGTSYADTSYIIETAAKGFTGSYFREFRITFGQEKTSKQKMYVVSYYPYFGGVLTLGKSTDNFYYPQTLDEAVLFPNLLADKWYKFKIARYKSGLIQVFVDKGTGYSVTPLLEAIDSTYSKMGHVGWRVDTETFPEGFYVDWVQATIPAVEKPAENEKPTEDDLITQVSTKSEKSYKVTKLANGINAYSDRSYTITSVPPYMNGISFLQTAMDDKKNNTDSFLTSFLKKDAIVYVCYDPRAKTLPAWLQDWTKTGDRIELTDPGTPYVDVYSKLIEYGQTYPNPFILGGNLASPAVGAQMNYLLAAVERPKGIVLEAENAALSGARKRSNHPGYSGTGFADYINATEDYIEWETTINLPGTYSINFGYANGSAADRPLQISVDGTNITSLPFSTTSSWSSWAFTSGPQIFLSQGSHKIKATAIGTSGPNMDYLSLAYISASPIQNIQTKNNFAFSNQERSASQQNPIVAEGTAYPNPFVKSTTVSYQVEKTSRVQLALHSMQGQQVQLLINETKRPGRYTATLDGSNLAPGVYLYRLQIGNKTYAGKLVKM